MAFAETDLQRIDQPLAGVGAGGQAVDQDVSVVEVVEFVIFGLIQLDGLAAAVEPGKSLLQKHHQERPGAHALRFGFFCFCFTFAL